MRVKFFLITLFMIPCLGFSLLEKPWFGDVLEFHLLSSFFYSHYNKVEGAEPPLASPSNDFDLNFNLDLTTTPQWCYDANVEFVDTPRQSFSFSSTALQGRYLWLDDIIGDPISLATGMSLRYVSTRSLHDVSCPYHAKVDIEASLSLGKEIDRRGDWLFRFWGFGAVGMGNQGSPWVRGIVSVEGNFDNQQQWSLYARGAHTYGRKTTIDIENFDGYGKVRQKSVDVGVGYGYCVGVWGTVKAEYMRRVLAKRCPENLNIFVFRYFLPFSF